ncbi:MAG: ankyrin repeat domain-containing protein [Epsilonproteobacteria bacterium]|nr:ankyrin repeat domain-containing protein [Campylobacterota bacterium]
MNTNACTAVLVALCMMGVSSLFAGEPANGPHVALKDQGITLVFDASVEDINARLKPLMTRYHPDSGAAPDREKFEAIDQAYKTMTSPHYRMWLKGYSQNDDFKRANPDYEDYLFNDNVKQNKRATDVENALKNIDLDAIRQVLEAEKNDPDYVNEYRLPGKFFDYSIKNRANGNLLGQAYQQYEELIRQRVESPREKEAKKKTLQAIAQQFVDAGHTINFLYPDQNTASRTFLHHLVEQKHLEWLKIVLSAAQDVAVLVAQDRDGNTPLHKALQMKVPDMVQALLAPFTIEQETLNVKNRNDVYLLGMALADEDMQNNFLYLFLDKNVNQVFGEKKETALHYAVRMGQVALANTILDKYSDKLDVCVQDSIGETVLHVATRVWDDDSDQWNSSLFKKILELNGAGDALNSKSKKGKTPLELAQTVFEPEQLKQLGPLFAQHDPITIFTQALQSNDEQRVADVLDKTVFDETHVDAQQRNPVHLLVLSNFSVEQKERLISQARSKGISDNEVDVDDKTPLDHALEKNERELVEYFLWAGLRPSQPVTDDEIKKLIDRIKQAREAKQVVRDQNHENLNEKYLASLDVKNIRDENGRSLLHDAVYSGTGKAINLLLKQGARIYVKDNEGKTPWDLAIDASIKKPLQDNLNQQLLYAIEDNDVPAVDYLLDIGANIKATGVLHGAIDQNNFEMFKHLLEKGAPRNGSRDDMLVLQYLVLKDRLDWAKYILDLELPAYLNQQSPTSQWTPLHFAVFNGKLDFVRLFMGHDKQFFSPAKKVNVQNKVDLTIKNNLGHSAIDVLDDVEGKISSEAWSEINDLLRWGDEQIRWHLNRGDNVSVFNDLDIKAMAEGEFEWFETAIKERNPHLYRVYEISRDIEQADISPWNLPDIKDDKFRLLNVFIKAGAKVNYVPKKRQDGDSLLHLAVKDKKWEFVEFFRSCGADERAKNNDGKSARELLDEITKSAEGGDEEAKKIKNVLSTSYSPLFLALEKDNKIAFEAQFRDDPNTRRNPFRDGMSLLQHLIKKDKYEWAEYLLGLDVPAEVNFVVKGKNVSGDTALHTAIKEGKPEFVKLLLAQNKQFTDPVLKEKINKVDLNIQNARGKTVRDVLNDKKDEEPGKMTVWDEIEGMLLGETSAKPGPSDPKPKAVEVQDSVTSLLQVLKLKILHLLGAVSQ